MRARYALPTLQFPALETSRKINRIIAIEIEPVASIYEALRASVKTVKRALAYEK